MGAEAGAPCMNAEAGASCMGAEAGAPCMGAEAGASCMIAEAGAPCMITEAGAPCMGAEAKGAARYECYGFTTAALEAELGEEPPVGGNRWGGARNISKSSPTRLCNQAVC